MTGSRSALSVGISIANVNSRSTTWVGVAFGIDGARRGFRIDASSP